MRCAAWAIAGVCAGVPARAGAIGYATPDGLSFPQLELPGGEVVELRVPAGGVITLPGVVRSVSHADAIAGLTLELGDEDGALVTTAEVVSMRAQLELSAVTEYVAVVFRPEAPLVAGAEYTGTLVSATSSPPQFAPIAVHVVVVEPTGALTPDFAALEFSQSYAPVDGSEICCEVEADSVCLATRFESRPQVGAKLAADRLTLSQGYAWAIGVGPDGEEMARTVDEFCGTVVAPELRCGGSVRVEYAAAQAEYCLVSGVTSLVDGGERRGEMRCDAGGAIDPPQDRTEAVLMELGQIECVGELLYADGSPVTPRAEGCGCLSGQVGGGWFVVAPLLWRRRRR